MDIPMVFSMISFRLLGVFGAFFYHDAAVFSWHNTRSYSEYTQNWYAKRLGEFGFGASEDGTVWTKGLMHDLSLDYGWLWTDHFLRCNLYILTCFGSIMFKKCSKRFLRSNYVYVFKICVNHVNHQLISSPVFPKNSEGQGADTKSNLQSHPKVLGSRFVDGNKDIRQSR